MFQSTLPRRERRDSTHKILSLRDERFNPRSRVGSDVRQYRSTFPGTWFQSTLPRRERHRTAVNIALDFTRFNPRSRVGSDHFFRCTIFINNSFNPRSRVGSDRSTVNISTVCFSFNPRSRVGSDQSNEQIRPIVTLFQSTLPRRERRNTLCYFGIHRQVSIHAPA